MFLFVCLLSLKQHLPFKLYIHKAIMQIIQKWIYLQEHNQQHHPDGNLRQEPTKQPPLHFISWSELQSTPYIITPLSFNLSGNGKKEKKSMLLILSEKKKLSDAIWEIVGLQVVNVITILFSYMWSKQYKCQLSITLMDYLRKRPNWHYFVLALFSGTGFLRIPILIFESSNNDSISSNIYFIQYTYTYADICWYTGLQN